MKKSINNKGFMLTEILIGIGILMFLTIMYMTFYDNQGANDNQRTRGQAMVQEYLQQFQRQYGVYPNNNSTGRNYPSSGCNVSGYGELISCFVTLDYLIEGTEDYELVRYDPSEGEYNRDDQEYTYYYGTASRGNMYKVCALAGKQNNYQYGLDGNEAEDGFKYICATSPRTNISDVTTLNN